MLGKLKSLFGAKNSTPSSPAGQIQTLLVSKEAASKIAQDPYALVQSVIEFVNAMTSDGLFKLSELPPAAVQAYYSDYYLAQVNNGGHSQFIHNSRMQQETLSAIEAGLEAMGATEALAVFHDMLRWVAENPDEAAAQTGFSGGRAEYLDTLDKRFYAAERNNSMVGLSAKWLASLEVLTALPASELPAALKRSADMNPHLENRKMAARVGRIQTMLTDELHGAFGYAANQVSGNTPVHALGAGSYFKIDGTDQLAFSIAALGANYFGVKDETGAHLYERIEHDNPKIDRNNLDDMSAALKDGRMAAFKAPEVGAKLVHIPQETLQDIVTACGQLHAAAAVDLLLRCATPDPGLTYVSVAEIVKETKTGKFRLKLMILTENNVAVAALFPDGAILHQDGGVTTKRPMKEILAHVAAVEA